MSIIDKLPLTSHDIAADSLEQLRAIFPEVFSEGKIDHDALHRALGQWIDPGKERFGLNWPGKVDCMRVIQSPSIGTLLPVPEESINFDTSENLIIEGDNLEVLKLLQKSYYGKVKMIYIDPPYNTGNEFIYPDNYREGLDEYLKFSGQVDAEGYKISTNTETGGRYHSRWLSMMYPRLFLAKNLLSDDGVIFVSIDDNEVHNLRSLMNEVFGEENFIGVFIFNSSPSAIDYGHLAKMHEYAICFSKSQSETVTYQLPEEDKEFKYEDKTGPFNIYPLYNGNVAFNPKTRPNLFYPFYLNPDSKLLDDFYEIDLDEHEGWVKVLPVVSRKDGIQRVWRWGKDKARKGLNDEIVGYKTEGDEYRVVQKTRHTAKVIRSLQLDTAISSRRGTGEVEEIFGTKIFNFPKPIELVKRFTTVSTSEDDIILDFFAGSGTTAHAVLDLNKEDSGNRKFILVQLPEKTDNMEYPTIAHITRERVRRVIKKLNDADTGKLDLDGAADQDRGFKSFHLSSSNFKVWDGDAAKAADVGETLSLFTDNIITGRSQDDILYELLLKAGFPLTAPLEKLTLAGKEVFSIDGGKLLVCLDKELTLEVIEAMVAKGPKQILCLDEGFRGNDQLKVNVVQTVKSHNRREEADIVFRVV